MELLGTVYLGAALLLVLLALLPALDRVHITFGGVTVSVLALIFGDIRGKRPSWRDMLREIAFDDLGAVTVTYYIRGANTTINGSTTAPTAAQASGVMKQSAIIVFGIVDDILGLFTHNWGLDASAPTYQEPEILMEPISFGTTSWPLITFWRANTNVVQVMKRAGDKETTVMVTLRRPHSIGQ